MLQEDEAFVLAENEQCFAERLRLGCGWRNDARQQVSLQGAASPGVKNVAVSLPLDLERLSHARRGGRGDH